MLCALRIMLLTSQDFGLKHYGGPKFKSLQQRGGEIFVTLQMVASNAKAVEQKKKAQKKNRKSGNDNNGGQQWQAQPSQQPVQQPVVNNSQPVQPEPEPYIYPAEDNSTYYNTGGCFDRTCFAEVLRGDGIHQVR